ncbi:hypothetical protein FGG08_001712 [Glutinoglossum americanum]|uniref:RWD domain-containing protein n=1 Tax=Glutinoglossum americanum TaxID=1670608 RepID=A0A9P8IAP5_9PEZI|nr:hypothetical protein FGG08_001712 [Glutinoglossum americanum]
MGREEQIEEREVLGSIFPDEIIGSSILAILLLERKGHNTRGTPADKNGTTDISDTEFRISIVLDIPNDDDTGIETPSILLHVTLPEAYPDDGPTLDLSLPPSAPKYPYLDIPTDKLHLLETLTPTITENLGMQMIFTLVSTLKETTESLIAERQAAVRAEHEARIQKQEEEENRKFHGTMVTRETFLEWRRKFKANMEEEGRRRREAEMEERGKKGGGQVAREERKAMTGRELWEKGLVGKVDEDEEGGESEGETIESGVGKLSVAAA